MDTSFYTKEQFKAFKSMEAYNLMISGFITSVQGKVICDKFVVIAKVRHSQRMNEPPLPVWIITSKKGTVISAHCLGCKAGLSETCGHVASLSFYIETWTRINGKLACTLQTPFLLHQKLQILKFSFFWSYYTLYFTIFLHFASHRNVIFLLARLFKIVYKIFSNSFFKAKTIARVMCQV